MNALRRPDPTRTPRPDPDDGVDGVTVAILVVGLIPIAGLLFLGSWPQGDLAVAALFVLFAGWQLLRHWRRPR